MDWLFSENMDDFNVLPQSIIPIYQRPHRCLGLDESSCTVALLRETFRKTILGYIPYFSGLGEPKLKLRQVLLAYHLIRGTIPKKSSVVKEMLDGRFFDFKAEDILPILHPVNSESLKCAKEYRGFRMLNISYTSNRTEYLRWGLPKVYFIFDVHYIFRRHTVEKTFRDFHELFDELSTEMVTMPNFPKASFSQIIGLQSNEVIGDLLAEFMTRVHFLYASMNMFSPRLLKFLNIEFEKIQAEEVRNSIIHGNTLNFKICIFF